MILSPAVIDAFTCMAHAPATQIGGATDAPITPASWVQQAFAVWRAGPPQHVLAVEALSVIGVFFKDYGFSRTTFGVTVEFPR